MDSELGRDRTFLTKAVAKADASRAMHSHDNSAMDNRYGKAISGYNHRYNQTINGRLLLRMPVGNQLVMA